MFSVAVAYIQAPILLFTLYTYVEQYDLWSIRPMSCRTNGP